MHYEIYIDVVFVTNLLMDYILLRFTGKIFRCGKSRGRTLLGALLGALFSCCILYVPAAGFLPAVILLHGACAVGMLVVGCGLKKGSLLVKAVLTLYMAAFLCGGFWEAAKSENLTARAFVLFAAVTCLGASAWSYLADSIRIRMKNVYPVTLVCGGRSKSFYGFYDSGNLLMDSVTRKPVSIGKPDILYDLLPAETADQLKHLKENPGGAARYGGCRASASFRYFSKYWKGTGNAAGGHTGETLYSDPGRGGAGGQTGFCICVGTLRFW